MRCKLAGLTIIREAVINSASVPPITAGSKNDSFGSSSRSAVSGQMVLRVAERWNLMLILPDVPLNHFRSHPPIRIDEPEQHALRIVSLAESSQFRRVAIDNWTFDSACSKSGGDDFSSIADFSLWTFEEGCQPACYANKVVSSWITVRFGDHRWSCDGTCLHPSSAEASKKG